MLSLLILPLLLRILGGNGPSDAPWRWGPELLLALVCGLAVGPLCGFWMAEFYLIHGEHLTSDFTEYCEAVVVRSRGDLQNFSRNRSLLAALPAGLLLPRVGLVDAMTAPGLLSVGVMASGLYLWGRALHGRLAGICCAISIGAFMPLVLLTRMMSFYPEVTAALTLSAGLAAVAVRVRTPAALVAGSIGVILSLLIDLRGLIFALPYLGLVFLAALLAPPRRWPFRLAIPVLGLVVAWHLADQAYLPHSASLEGQVFFRQRLQDRGIPVPPELLDLAPTEYVWGRSDPREIPQTLMVLREHSQIAGALLRGSEEGIHNYRAFIKPWLKLLNYIVVIIGIGILSRPGRLWRLAVLGATCVPFAVSMRGALDTQQGFLRFIASSQPWMALLLGLCFAILCEGGARRGTQRLWSGLRIAVGGGLLLLLVLGAIPSHISPTASWRSTQPRSDHEVIKIIQNAEQQNPRRAPVCVQQLITEENGGQSMWGRLYGGITH